MRINATEIQDDIVYALVLHCDWDDRHNIKRGDVSTTRVVRWAVHNRVIYPVSEEFGILDPKSAIVLPDGKIRHVKCVAKRGLLFSRTMWVPHVYANFDDWLRGMLI